MQYLIHLLLTITVCISFVLFSDVFKKLPNLFKLLLLYVFLNGIYYSYLEPFAFMGSASSMSLRIISSNSLLYFILQVLFIFTLSEKYFEKFFGVMIALAYISAVITIIRFFLGQAPAGLGLNSSTEGTFLAIMMPLIWLGSKVPNQWIKVIPVIAVFLTTSSVGIFGAMFSLIVYQFLMDKKKLIYTLVPFFAIAVMAFLYVGSDLFSTSLRYNQWVVSVKWWLENANYAIGTGLGSYQGFGPYIQQLQPFQPTLLFTNAHSDWLQICFELGIVGLFLSLCSLILLLKKSITQPILFSAILTFAVVASMNMPLRYSITSMAGLMLVRMAYENKKFYFEKTV